jgi:hypothetical protein
LLTISDLQDRTQRQLLAQCKNSSSKSRKPKSTPTPTSIKWKPASESEAFKEISSLFVKHITPGSPQCAELIEMLDAYFSARHIEAVSETEKFLETMPTIQTVAFEIAA